MSKPKTPGAYGFTTKSDDDFLPRIAREAKPRDAFLVTTAKHAYKKEGKVIILVRCTALPPKTAGLTVLGQALARTGFGAPLPNGFRFIEVPVGKKQNIHKLANTAKTELQRAKNFIAGRHLRVLVEAV